MRDGLSENDYKITINNFTACTIITLLNNLITCNLTLNHSDIITNINDDGGYKNARSKVLIKFVRSINKTTQDQTTHLSSSSSQNQLVDTIYMPIRVIIGKNYNNLIGYLSYENINANANSVYNNNLGGSGGIAEDLLSSKYIIIIASICCFILFAIMITLLIIFRVKQSKQTKQLKMMQIEFENLESRVANECKEAFAELQMDIGELANTLNQNGPPFNDFANYSLKILFPNASDYEKKLFLNINSSDPTVSIVSD